MHTNLDMDCLRTFVAIIDAGSFAEAALRVGRTASAVSLQISRLEEQVGAKLFQKDGRRKVPSAEGEQLAAAARQLLALNDQIVETLSHQALSGEISMGAIQDIADGILPSVLGQFRQFHPDVRITAHVGRSKSLVDEVESGKLDLAIGVSGLPSRSQKVVKTDRIVWLGHKTFTLPPDQPVPLVVFEPPCTFRDAAISSLNKAGREWKIVFTTPSLSGLRAAVEAGLGITARTSASFQGQLPVVDKSARLPVLPRVKFALYADPNLSDAGVRLSEIFIEVLDRGI